jgi:hypothetical protein
VGAGAAPPQQSDIWREARLFRWPHYNSAERPAEGKFFSLADVVSTKGQGGTHYFIMRHCPACHNLKVMGTWPWQPDSSTNSSTCLAISPHWTIIAELEPVFSFFREEEVQFCASVIFRAVLTCALLIEKYRIYKMLSENVEQPVEVGATEQVMGGPSRGRWLSCLTPPCMPGAGGGGGGGGGASAPPPGSRFEDD